MSFSEEEVRKVIKHYMGIDPGILALVFVYQLMVSVN